MPQRKGRRRVAGTVKEQIAQLLAASHPDRPAVLAVLSQHPDTAKLFNTDFREWQGTPPFPASPNRTYARYLLLWAAAARERAITAWLDSLGFKVSLETVTQWAAFLPALQDDDGHTFRTTIDT